VYSNVEVAIMRSARASYTSIEVCCMLVVLFVGRALVGCQAMSQRSIPTALLVYSGRGVLGKRRQQ